MRWLEAASDDDLFLSVLTLGELRRGILKLPQGARRGRLDAAYRQLFTEYADRILDVDAPVAEVWAEVTLRDLAAGRPTDAVDELLAATALLHGLTVVTRNVRDFESTGCAVLSPLAWMTPAP